MIDGENVVYDVQVENAFKSYDAHDVIIGLSMNVMSGTIYGLLGPSGCGKTTLLHCILGKKTLDSGYVDLKADSLKDVGYMPQDLCLDESLTIKETFEYYGTLYNMKKKHIKSRIDELNRYLQLPDLDRYIKDISGGQSRRVSIAISLLHDPKVIILDEPTVGIDPVLRNEIWNEFTKMVEEQKKTIIITTHYIEEANQAHCIGLMRKGVLVEEGSPRDILAKHSTDSLETAFLTICCKKEEDKTFYKSVEINGKTQSKTLTKFKSNIELYRIKALLKKNYHVCHRDYILLFTMILLPVLQTFNFCTSIGLNFKNLPIAIKNDEVNFFDCKNYSDIDVCIYDNFSNQTMSCIVMNYLTAHDYALVEVKDRKAGEMSMKNPEYMAFLYFPENYTREFAKHYINDSQNFDRNSLIFVHLTKENFLFRNQIKMDLLKSINHLMDKTLDSCSFNPKILKSPLKFNTLSGIEINSFEQSTITIFIALLTNYCSSIFALSMMLSEKLDGILSRSMFAGVKISELTISLFCIDTVIIAVQIVPVCYVSYVVHANPIQITDGLFVYALLMLLLGWSGFFFGILTAVLSTSVIDGINIITGLTFTQILLSGIFWPLEGQPKFLRYISRFLPTRLVGNTMNNIALKGWTWNHPSIVMDTAVTLMSIILFIIVLIILGKFKKHLWVVQK